MLRPQLHIVSHGPQCLDGVAAAATVARFHEGAEIDVRFASNKEVNQVLREICPRPGSSLWITDISWNDAETEAHLAELIRNGVALHWFDHHRTAIERMKAGGFQLEFATQVVRDEFAASKLVYDFLAQQLATKNEDTAQPGSEARLARFRSFAPIVAMADDNDRWIHAIPGSRELGLVLRAMTAGEAYHAFLELDETLTDTPAMAAARKRIQEELSRNRALAEATRFDIDAHGVHLVSALCDGYAGEIADEWGKRSARTVFVLFDVRSQSLSFRRSPDHDFDLSKLAEKFGGGGHAAAAGASVAGLPVALGETISRRILSELRS